MQIVLVTNRLTHHQTPLCMAMQDEAVEFRVVVCQPIAQGREHAYPDYRPYGGFLVERYAGPEEYRLAQELIDSADVVIIGSAPISLVENRLKQNRLTFRYSERFYKQKRSLWQLPRDFLAAWKHHGRFQRYPLYMLCASAYTATDAARFGSYKGRCYKWGYFPRTIVYDDVEQLLDGKEPNRLLWVGRMLDWKHPEAPVEVARRLAEQGRDFHLDMIGTGPVEGEIRELVARYGLGDRVTLLGSKTPDEVRAHMERASIYLFTSDRGEGWGAVLNEAMNSGCAVVASHAIGAAPFLIRDGENGLMSRSGDTDMLYDKVAGLLDEPDRCRALGRAAYRTIADEWNAANAARRLVALSEVLIEQSDGQDLYAHGPCSQAEILGDSWYKGD